MSKELAADYFSRHQSDECHITSDNRVFHTLGSAQSFASGLPDDKVKSYKRAEIEAPVVDDLENQPLDEATSKNIAKTVALEALKTFDPTTAKYPEIKELVKMLGIDPATQKQPDLLAAIEAYKTAINTEVKE
ncbi:MAG: hypothetical protein V4497_01255 [Bacteroidota bacterium]